MSNPFDYMVTQYFNVNYLVTNNMYIVGNCQELFGISLKMDFAVITLTQYLRFSIFLHGQEFQSLGQFQAFLLFLWFSIIIKRRLNQFVA